MKGKKLWLAAMAALTLMLTLAVAAGAETTPATAVPETTASSDYQEVIAFLKEQAKEHDEFAGKQYKHLVWLAGAVATIVGGAAVYLGLETSIGLKKKVQARIDHNLEKVLGDEKQLPYLKKSIAREKKAHTLRVLFAAMEGDAGDIDDVRKFFAAQRYRVSAETVAVDKKSICGAAQKYDAIVLRVPNAEYGEKRDEPDDIYRLLAARCEKSRKKQCILYCPGFGKINPEKMNDQFVSTVQTHAKLRETLYMMLYFSPLNED